MDWDDDGNVIIPEAHQDLTMRHGRHGRNNDCYNCHDREDLRYFRTKDGTRLGAEQSNLICASCHGPRYRDWELGIHGRQNGYWTLDL